MRSFKLILATALLLSACRTKPSPGYHCSGTEPFWTMEYQDGTFFFNSMDGGDPVELTYLNKQITANPRKIILEFSEGALTLEPATSGCVYDVSGEGNFEFTAVFLYNQIPYKGCAREVRPEK